MVSAAAGRARILHAHFASFGAADVVFEQEAPDVAALEQQISKLTSSADFQTWSGRMSALLIQSPKREVYIVADWICVANPVPSCRGSSSAWCDRMRGTRRGGLSRGWRPLPYPREGERH